MVATRQAFRFFDVSRPGDAPSVIRAHQRGFYDAAVSPDGRRFAAGSIGQEAVRLWDAKSRRELPASSGEGSIFHALQFSPHRRLQLAINSAGLERLWFAPSWAKIGVAEAKDPPAPRSRGQGSAGNRQPGIHPAKHCCARGCSGREQ